MTKEDVPEWSEGDSVQGRHSRLSHGVEGPVIHQVASAPMPTDCEFSFFDPSEPQCRAVLLDPGTTVPELFAVLRQWVPQVQKNIDLIGNEILKRGCGVNDRDGLTDMSLLHYCCKAGAPGIGDADTAAILARRLLSLGAEPGLRSRWTNMSALHYAAYFDVPQLIRVVLGAATPGEVDATCCDFDFGTALHIAASNLCTAAVKSLLELGANPAFRNTWGQTPADVVPSPVHMPLDMADAAALAKELRLLLTDALPRPSTPLALPPPPRPPEALSDRARAQLSAMGVRLADRVTIAGQKVGTLRFCGSTEFSGGLWAGVELDQPEGKNDGSVAGVHYFTCRPKHGIFAPLSKISKTLERRKTKTRLQKSSSTPVRPPRRIDQSHAAARMNTGLLSRSLSSSSSSLDSRHEQNARPRPLPRQRPPARPRRERVPSGSRATPPGSRATPPPSRPSPSTTLTGATGRSRTPSASSWVCEGPEVSPVPEVRLGERVLVVGQRTGVIRFYGQTSFSPGFWLGIELDKPGGKNDGSVGGVRYFRCPPKHGVFAPPSRVQRIHGSVDCLSELSSSCLNRPFTGIRRSLSTSSTLAMQKETNRKSPVNRARSHPHRRRASNSSGGVSTPAAGGVGVPVGPGNGPWACPDDGGGGVRLRPGMQVLLSGAQEMALVRYVGPADFAPGVWLGLELRGGGRNDGSVGGRRYFRCRPGRGVLVRPGRVTYHGISGARLL